MWAYLASIVAEIGLVRASKTGLPTQSCRAKALPLKALVAICTDQACLTETITSYPSSLLSALLAPGDACHAINGSRSLGRLEPFAILQVWLSTNWPVEYEYKHFQTYHSTSSASPKWHRVDSCQVSGSGVRLRGIGKDAVIILANDCSTLCFDKEAELLIKLKVRKG